MTKSFTEKAIKVVMLAQEEARRSGHNSVGTGQLLLGLIAEATGVAAQVLRTAGVKLKEARVEVEKISGRGEGFQNSEISFNDDAKRVFALSLEEAERLKRQEIAPEHLLLGLLRDGEGTAIRVLQNLRVDPIELRTQVLRRLADLGDENAVQFLLQVLKATYDSDGNPRVVYPLLQSKLDKLNDDFAQMLRSWAASTLSTAAPVEAVYWAWALGTFGNLLVDFPQGDKGSNIEIAIAGLESASLLYTKTISPSHWAVIQGRLARAFRNRIRGNAEENVEKAIELYHKVLEVYTKTDCPEDWADVQTNLGVAYAYRIRQDRAENLKQALSHFETALQVYTQKDLPEKWGAVQYNMGRFNGDLWDACLQDEERAEICEQEIKCFENALQVYTRAAHPEMWGNAQLNLGSAYSKRVKGEPVENQERAIRCFEKALQVRFREVSLQKWAEAEWGLGIAYLRLGTNQEYDDKRVKSFNLAIEHHENSLEFYAKEKFKNEWESIEKNLRFLYSQCHVKAEVDNSEQETEQSSAVPSEEEKKFLKLLWLVTSPSQEELNNLHPILEENLDKLNDNFPGVLRTWATTNLANEDSFFADIPLKIKISRISLIGILIFEFQGGNRATNVEIAIAAFEVSIILLSQAAEPEVWANIQSFLGTAYSSRIRGEKKDNLNKAIECHKNALLIFKPETSPQLWAENQIRLAATYTESIGEEREENLEKAIDCYKKNANIFYKRETFPERWAELQLSLASVYEQRIRGRRSDNLEEAKKYCENAVKLFEEKGDRENWAKAIVSLGIIYSQRLVGEAAENQEKAIAYYKESSEVLSRERFPQAWAVNQSNLANDYLFRIRGERAENVERAINYCQNALLVRTRQDFPEKWASSQNTLGKAYFHRIRGDRAENLEQALDCYKNALQIYTREAYPENWAATQINLAMTYIERKSGEAKNNLETAIACCEHALQVFTYKEFSWAQAHQEMAIAYRNGENWEKAIECFEKALQVFTPDNYPKYCCINYNNLASVYLHRSRETGVPDLEKAIPNLEKAWQIANQNGFLEECAVIQTNLGSVYNEYIRTGQAKSPDLALSYCKNALQFFTAQGFPELHATALLNLGFAYQGNQQFENAYKVFARAIYQVESLRFEMISGDQAKQNWAENFQDVYRSMVSVCLKLGTTEPKYNAKALEYGERSKARNLVEFINSRDRYPKGISEIERSRLKQLKQAIANTQRQLYMDEAYGLSGDSTSSERRRTHLRQELNDLRQQQDELIQLIAPNFRLAEKVNSISFKKIQALLSDDRTCCISWYFLGKTLVTFIITRQSKVPIVLPADGDKVLEWFWHYFKVYEEIKREEDEAKRDENRKQWQDSLASRFKELAEILKLERVIAEIKRLEVTWETTYDQVILIPHWLLHLFPLHALPLSEFPCLLDRFPKGVRYAPSCQLLQLTQNVQRPEFKHFFAIQDPATPNVNPLPYSNLEVDTIHGYFDSATVLAKENATKVAFNQVPELRLAHCIHFSCHGYFINAASLLSGLVLADERLTLGEILDLNLSRCRLVFLSACETSLADWNTVSEYVSLPSGFLYAGSPSVVGSLWTVDDRSTAFLTIRFYQNLLADPERNVALALNLAQIWLRDVTKEKLEEWTNQLPLDTTEKKYLRRFLNKIEAGSQPFQQPYHWAAFCAVGQ